MTQEQKQKAIKLGFEVNEAALGCGYSYMFPEGDGSKEDYPSEDAAWAGAVDYINKWSL